MQHDYVVGETGSKENTLDKTQALDQFLAGIERKAFKIAEIAVGNREEALDIVQDSMLGLVQKYADRPSEEWTPLFYRILQSRIRDWYRKNKVRSRWMSWLTFRKQDDDQEQEDPVQGLADPVAREPMQTVANENAIEKLEAAIQKLPARQQQAFMLRAWEGLNVADTAIAMACSQGSVKTHYSRAVNTLRKELEEHWP
jgi:RNA polymerase sigma-70 factor (ECF subfamily)